jgi:hypothetical protein
MTPVLASGGGAEPKSVAPHEHRSDSFFTRGSERQNVFVPTPFRPVRTLSTTRMEKLRKRGKRSRERDGVTAKILRASDLEPDAYLREPIENIPVIGSRQLACSKNCTQNAEIAVRDVPGRF